MPPRRSSPDLLGVMALVTALGLAGCSGGGTPSGPPAPVRPARPTAAKPPEPASPAAPGAPAYAYEVKGRRDPFQPLIVPRVATPRPRPKTGLAALDVNELKLAGIIWGRQGLYALVEAPNGTGYVLRVNDNIGEEARVTKITPEAVTFEVKPETPLPKEAQVRLVELRLRKEE